MAIEHLAGGSTIITGPHIEVARLLVLRSALSLELKGIRVLRGRTAYTIVKRDCGLKGSRASVLAQLERVIAEARLIANQLDGPDRGDQ
jgi:hypothetical protein